MDRAGRRRRSLSAPSDSGAAPTGDLQLVSGGVDNLLVRLAGAAPRDLYTRHEAAVRLGVSVSTIDRMRADGQLAVVTIRRRVFIPATELRRIAASVVRTAPRGDVRHREGVVVTGPLW